MTRDTPLYKLAPVTGSTADFLAQAYGATNPEDFAERLPESAQILDVGAGNSELGRVVASYRPDITWTNFDRAYDTTRLERLKAGAPANLRFVEGDILAPVSDKATGAYDQIYAFWVLPHLGLEDPALVRVGIENMLAMLHDTGEDGKLTVGPLVSSRTPDDPSTTFRVAETTKDASEAELTKLAEDSTIPSELAWTYRAINRAGVGVLRHKSRTGQEPTRLGLWDIQKDQYLKALSPRGLRLTGGLAMHLAVEKLRS